MTAVGARARVRAELTREITDVARRHLASDGAASLSLRAVARELGMASSAVYRYFPSRDDLLTALIVEAYDALGDAAERAETAAPRTDLRARWLATCRATRAWALAHPHEYALVYGSPVPGYAAPQATIGPAARVGEVLCRIVAEGIDTAGIDTAGIDTAGIDTAGIEAGVIDPADDPKGADTALAPGVREQLGLPWRGSDSSLATRAIQAWTSVFGMISFELFGHTANVVLDHERFFTDAVDRLATAIGLP